MKQSGGNWERQRPLTIVALSSLRTEDGKQSESWTNTLLNKKEAGCSERDRMSEALAQTSVL